MPRSDSFHRLLRAWRAAEHCAAAGISARAALEEREEAADRRLSRREVLRGAALAAAASPLRAASAASGPRVAIVGAGLAGLACADRLQARGYQAQVYEAAPRLGGRCFSNRTLVPGMACENGGELIDTGHKTMLAYANEFGLPLESYLRKAGDEVFDFFGRRWTEEEVVEQFRAVVQNMQPDLRAISGSATFFGSNAADVRLDNTDLASYFAARTAGYPLIQAVLNEAYLAEYGLETWQQSTLNFLGFMRLNRQSKFEPFGVSDERYHLVDGNDGIVRGLESKLRRPVQRGARLTRMGRSAAGKYLLYFNGGTVPEVADAVVLAIPFTVLRQVTLERSLGFSADKLRAIRTLGYGANAKTMVAFHGRPWEELYGAGGGVYSDRAHLQNTWETNRANAVRTGILTDYASGDRGAALRTSRVQAQVDSFLTDLDRALPGLKARALRSGGRYVAHLEHWPTNPLTLGSYTCYTPGQFTTVAGLEGQPAGLVKFAGEHADSFYSWQGYMEGACLSGIRAADEVLADIRAGAL